MKLQERLKREYRLLALAVVFLSPVRSSFGTTRHCRRRDRVLHVPPRRPNPPSRRGGAGDRPISISGRIPHPRSSGRSSTIKKISMDPRRCRSPRRATTPILHFLFSRPPSTIGTMLPPLSIIRHFPVSAASHSPLRSPRAISRRSWRAPIIIFPPMRGRPARGIIQNEHDPRKYFFMEGCFCRRRGNSHHRFVILQLWQSHHVDDAQQPVPRAVGGCPAFRRRSLYGHLSGVSGSTIGLTDVYSLDKVVPIPASSTTETISSSTSLSVTGGIVAPTIQPKLVPVSDARTSMSIAPPSCISNM